MKRRVFDFMISAAQKTINSNELAEYVNLNGNGSERTEDQKNRDVPPKAGQVTTLIVIRYLDVVELFD